MAATSDDVLHTGDIVYISAVGGTIEDAKMHVHGFHDHRVGLVLRSGHDCADDNVPSFLRGHTQSFRDCLFRVCPAYQYAAKDRLRRMIGKQEQQRREVGQNSESMREEAERLAALYDRAAHEADVNAEQDLRISAPVAYEQKFQLRHVASGMFLSCAPRSYAEVERECVQVVLEHGGSKRSWVRLHRNLGSLASTAESVRYDAQCVLSFNHGVNKLFLHSRDDGSALFGGRGHLQRSEVNLAASPSTWRMRLFRHANRSIERGGTALLPNSIGIRGTTLGNRAGTGDEREILPIQTLHYGDPMRLQLSHTRSGLSAMLTADVHGPRLPLSRLSASSSTNSSGGTVSEEVTAMATATTLSQDVVHAPWLSACESSTKNVDSREIFFIEGLRQDTGGEIMWYSTVRLRHFGSGRYLACDSTSARDEHQNAAVSLCTKLVHRSESTGETSARTASDKSAYGNTTDDATIDAHKMAAAEDVDEKISSAALQDGTNFIIVPPESRAITVESTNDAVPIGARFMLRAVWPAKHANREPQRHAWPHWCNENGLLSTASARTAMSGALEWSPSRDEDSTFTLCPATAQEIKHCTMVHACFHTCHEFVSRLRHICQHEQAVGPFVSQHGRSLSDLSMQAEAQRMNEAMKSICSIMVAMQHTISDTDERWTDDPDISAWNLAATRALPQPANQQLASDLKLIDVALWAMDELLLIHSTILDAFTRNDGEHKTSTSLDVHSRQSLPRIESHRVATVAPSYRTLHHIENAITGLQRLIMCCAYRHWPSQHHLCTTPVRSVTQYGLTGAQEQGSNTAPGDSCLDALITLIGHNNPAIADSAVNSTINLMEGSKHEQIVSFINRPILCRTIELLQSSRDAQVRFLHFFRSLIRDGGAHVVSIQEFLLRGFYSEGRLDEMDCSRNRLQLAIETCISSGEIFVSWYSGELDMPSIFPSPEKLGITSTELQHTSSLKAYLSRSDVQADSVPRRWIKLEHICGIVQGMQSTHNLNTNSHDSVHIVCEAVISHYCAQIQFYAALCAGRSANCSLALEKQFSEELCWRVLQSPALPAQVRGVFVSLLEHLYLDRPPQQTIQIPPRIKFTSHNMEHFNVRRKRAPGRASLNLNQGPVEEVPANVHFVHSEVMSVVDSVPGMVCLTTLVLAAIAYTAVNITTASATNEFHKLGVAKLVISIIFVFEVSARMYGMGASNYFRDTLCRIDVTVTVLDVMSVALEHVFQGSDMLALAMVFRILRVIRYFRFVRIARLARAANELKNSVQDRIMTVDDRCRYVYSMQLDGKHHMDQSPLLPCHDEQSKFEHSVDFCKHQLARSLGLVHGIAKDDSAIQLKVLSLLSALARFGCICKVDQIRDISKILLQSLAEATGRHDTVAGKPFNYDYDRFNRARKSRTYEDRRPNSTASTENIRSRHTSSQFVDSFDIGQSAVHIIGENSSPNMGRNELSSKSQGGVVGKRVELGAVSSFDEHVNHVETFENPMHFPGMSTVEENGSSFRQLSSKSQHISSLALTAKLNAKMKRLARQAQHNFTVGRVSSFSGRRSEGAARPTLRLAGFRAHVDMWSDDDQFGPQTLQNACSLLSHMVSSRINFCMHELFATYDAAHDKHTLWKAAPSEPTLWNRLNDIDSDKDSHLTPTCVRMLEKFAVDDGRHQKEFEILNIESLVEGNFADICKVVLMNQDYDLFNCSFELLRRHQCHLTEVIRAFNNARMFTILSTTDSESKVLLLKSIDAVRSAVDEFESWGIRNDFSDVDTNRERFVHDTLQLLAYKCFQELDDVSNDAPHVSSLIGTRSIDTGFQKFLEAADVHLIAISLFRLPHGERNSQVVLKLKCFAAELLTAFVCENVSHQRVIASHLDEIISVVSNGVEPALMLLSELALRNRKVSEAFTIDHVRCLLDQCDADQWPDFSCAIIDFLLQLCMPYGKLIGRLQDIVLPQLLDFAHQHSEALRPDREERQGETQASTETFITSFHVKLISTLALLSEASSSTTHMSLRSLLPADIIFQILDDLHDLRASTDAKLSFVRFFRAVHVDANFQIADPDISRPEIVENDPKLAGFLHFSVLEIERYTDKVAQGNIRALDRMYIEHGIMPTIIDMLHRNSALHHEDSEAASDIASLKYNIERLVGSHWKDSNQLRRLKIELDPFERLHASSLHGLDKSLPKVQKLNTASQHNELNLGSRYPLRRRSRPLKSVHDVATEQLLEFQQAMAESQWLKQRTDAEMEKFVLALTTEDTNDGGRQTDRRMCRRLMCYLLDTLATNKLVAGHSTFNTFTHVLITLKHSVMLHNESSKSFLRDLHDQPRPKSTNTAKESTRINTMAAELEVIAQKNNLRHRHILTELGIMECVVETIATAPSSRNDLVVPMNAHIDGERPRDARDIAMELGIAMMEDGDPLAQKSMFAHLLEVSSEAFFMQLDGILLEEISVIQDSRSQAITEQDDMFEIDCSSSTACCSIAMQLLQSMCEGHNQNMQNLLRDQATIQNSKTYNLVQRTADLVVFLAASEQVLLNKTSRAQLELLENSFSFLIEAVQGPNETNQLLLAQSSLLLACREISSTAFPTPLEQVHIKLKKNAMLLLSSLLEGRLDMKVHHIMEEQLDIALLRNRIIRCWRVCKENHAKDQTIFHKVYSSRNQARASTQSQRKASRRTHRQSLMSVSHFSGINNDEVLVEGYEEVRHIFTMIEIIGAESPDFRAACIPRAVVKPLRSSFRTEQQYLSQQDIYTRAKEFEDAYVFLRSKLRSVEIVWHDTVQRVYFLQPEICSKLSSVLHSEQENILHDIDFTADSDVRLASFFAVAEQLHNRLLQMAWLKQRSNLYAWLSGLPRIIRGLLLVVALMLNYIMLLSGVDTNAPANNVTLTNSTANPTFADGSKYAIYALGILHVLLSLITVVLIVVIEAPFEGSPMYDSAQQEYVANAVRHVDSDMRQNTLHPFLKAIHREVLFAAVGLAFSYPFFGYIHRFVWASAILYIITSCVKGAGALPRRDNNAFIWVMRLREAAGRTHSNLIWYALMLVISVLGVVLSPFFWSLLVLEAINLSKTLQNVVAAVTKSAKKLLMAAFLAISVVYSFTSFGFFMINSKRVATDVMPNCGNLSSCLTNVFYEGVIRGNPLTNGTVQQSRNFFAVEFMFYVVVATLLVNVVFGIILDQFGQLRDAEDENTKAMNGQCFICGIERSEFDSHFNERGQQNGFIRSHVMQEHNMWNYLFFIIYLREKDDTDFTGIDSFVMECLEHKDVSWVPRGRALCLIDAAKRSKAHEQQIGTALETGTPVDTRLGLTLRQRHR